MPRLPGVRDPLWWHLLLLLGGSALYESCFLHYGLNQLDEAWPLYAAMQLHAGGTLYRDVFFVFPPGHLLPAWIAWALDPPGVVAARALYAGFNVAVCGVIYLLGRRLVPPTWALFGAALLAIAAPYSHLAQVVFGYRFLVFSALALLAFAERLRSGDARWLFAAGLAVGVGLCFRVTPAFAACAGLGAGTFTASRSPRIWARDTAWLAAGFLLVVVPALAWFAQGVGLETLWREVLVRPVAMINLQSKPMPEIEWPVPFNREEIRTTFNALQFRLFIGLYLGYWLALGGLLVRSLLRRERFAHPLLLAVSVWGGVYIVRSLVRADVPHLESALPPAFLLVAHLGWLAARRLAPLRRAPPLARRAASALAFAGGLALWIFLTGVDLTLDYDSRGRFPVESLNGAVFVDTEYRSMIIDRRVTSLRQIVSPDDTILDLAVAPIFHVLSGRRGPGYADVVMPGTFLTDAEEEAFVERLEASPPALVIVREKPFDEMESRGLPRFAPRVTSWLQSHYRVLKPTSEYILWTPRTDASRP